MEGESMSYWISTKKPPPEDRPMDGSLYSVVVIPQADIDMNTSCLKALIETRLEFLRCTLTEALEEKGYKVE